ncbi:hypothetical protein [Natrinema halophilum]|uniref:Uncharacterized protein n=1 Tax=Natrinema halophilum TaxID=1699371 RepID=A0A7D5GFE0_9EURY|nr:hypothetical protein [Natrinema halophilum]QLG47568.1 hypothetical protein HYG82_01250 [Natrinema halophilum]
MLERLVHDERTNAAVGWLLVAIVALDGVSTFLRGAPLWAGFELVIAVVASIPALTTRDWTAMVPWPLLSVAALAVIAVTIGAPFETTVYVVIATLALAVVVELETFTTVELSRRFAVAFAVLTTMALQALWTIVQFYSDRWLGTDYLRSQTELQWDFVLVTAVGLVLGGLFQWYVTRFKPADGATRITDGTGSS